MRPRNANKLPDVHYGWALPDRRVSSTSGFLKISLKYCKLYCEYTKLAGFKYFVKRDSTWFDRMLWVLVYGITMPMMIYTAYCAYQDFMVNPLQTTVETEYFPTQELDFPGVAICNINRISRRAAMDLADELFASNISDLPFDAILDMISQLGDLYDSEFQVQNHLYRIDQLLSVFHRGYYSITDVMKRLTPQCSSMLSKCRFHAKDQNCSELFEFRKTQDGFCCTFNYAVKGDDVPLIDGVDRRVEALKVQNLTQEGGLTVVLEPFLDDYFYSIFPSSGWKVTIFNPYDYPDMASGGVIEVLASPKMHRSVHVDAIMLDSTRSIMPYSSSKRHCLFTDEIPSLRMFYTYSDCIVDCKIEEMWTTCGCIPFYLPNRASRKVCNLEDVACLSQHKSKWFSVVPHEDKYNEEDKHDHDGKHIRGNGSDSDILHCNNCYPECSNVNYVAEISMSSLKANEYIANLLSDVELKDQGVVTVYFNQIGTVKLKQDVIYRWYELMGNASGICGIYVGFSLIAIIEFAYFACSFILELSKGASLTGRMEKRAEREQPSIQAIYWGELYSNSRTTRVQRNRTRGKY